VKVLLDEMYSPTVAKMLRELGHDAISAHERPDLQRAPDTVIFETMRLESRAIVTNNIRDFIPLAQTALLQDRSFAGLILTTDRTFPRSRNTTGILARSLAELIRACPADDGLFEQTVWLTRP